jgi:hypothetical protein
VWLIWGLHVGSPSIYDKDETRPRKYVFLFGFGLETLFLIITAGVMSSMTAARTVSTW